MRFVSTAEMRELDRLASERFGIPSLILMENAGRSVADLAGKLLQKKKKVLIVCGKGNNGGDGFVAARHLFNRGHRVQVILLAGPLDLRGDAAANFKILEKMKIPIYVIQDCNRRGEACLAPTTQLQRIVHKADLIIDAIFGIGLRRPITGFIQDVIQVLNQSRKKILSVDIPSGLHGDTGRPMGSCVRADMTGTLALPKSGMMHQAAKKYTGKIEVLNISIPAQLL